MIVRLYVIATIASYFLYMNFTNFTSSRIIRDNNHLRRFLTTFRSSRVVAIVITPGRCWNHPRRRRISTVQQLSPTLVTDPAGFFKNRATLCQQRKMSKQQLLMIDVDTASVHPHPTPETRETPPKVVKIAIIGAGPAGLVAARVLSRTIQQLTTGNGDGEVRENPQFVITVFEKENDIGGVWKYNPKVDHTTSISSSPSAAATTKLSKKQHPVYRHLRTNLPKEIMAYREYPWKSVSLPLNAPPKTSPYIANDTDFVASHDNTDSNISYVPHYNVYEYLYNYCQQYQLEQLIRYNCTVRQLTCLPTRTTTSTTTQKSYFSPTSSVCKDEDQDVAWPLIQLKWDEGNMTKENKPQQKSDVFDSIFICNGHYNVPSYPNIPGLHEYFKGTVIHSVEYDIPDPFVNQTVLCIGGRASGSDIAREIANHRNGIDDPHQSTIISTRVYLSDTSFRKSSSNNMITQNNITWVPKTICVLPDGRVQVDSDSVEPIRVDTIILCTGYDYDFPFINESSNMIDFIGCERRRVQLLYEQLWYVSAPNIAFVGIPHSIIPFPLFEFQCEAVVQSWFRSTRNTPAGTASTTDNNTATISKVLSLPNRKKRYERAIIDANSGGYGKEKGRIPEDTHYLGPRQWDYCRAMAQYANIYNDTIESYIATNKVRETEF